MSSPQEENDLRLIRRALEQYFFAVDASDSSLVSDSFTEDGVFRTETNPQFALDGRQKIHEWFSDLTTFVASTHSLSNCHIVLDGDEASAVTHAVAHVVQEQSDGQVVAVRGLRYRDILRREGAVWKIHRRLHSVLWQYDAAASDPRLYLPPNTQ